MLARQTILVRRAAVFAAGWAASFALFNHVLNARRMLADFRDHLRFLRDFVDGKAPMPGHFLFHLLTAGISRLTGLSLEVSAAVVLSLAVAACALIVHELYLGSGEDAGDSEWRRSAATIAALTTSAIYFKGFNSIYVGQSGPNVWHNPTSIVLKPFALVAAIWLERIIFDGARGRAYVVVIAAVLIGMLAKPAFALVLIPTAGVMAAYMMLPPRWQKLGADRLPTSAPTRNFLMALVLLSAALLLAQALYIFGERRGITIAFLGVWRNQTPSVAISMLLALAFPLSVTNLDVKRGVPLRGLGLAWGFTIAGAVIYAFLAESGGAFMDGNFSWGYQIALAILFAFAFRSYARQWRAAPHGRDFVVTTALLTLHVASGAFYLYQIVFLRHFY